MAPQSGSVGAYAAPSYNLNWGWMPTPWFVLHRRLFGYVWRKRAHWPRPETGHGGFHYQTSQQRAREALEEEYNAPNQGTDGARGDPYADLAANYIAGYGGRRPKM